MARYGWLIMIALALLTVSAVHAQDDAAMVLIPAGPFTMGGEGKATDEDAQERPPHEVNLPAFYLDKCEVTTAQFAKFLNAVKKLQDEAGKPLVWASASFPLQQKDGQWAPVAGREKHPMAFVTWYGAMAYAKWAGKRLPTEAEFEKAARGADKRKFPWGDTFDPSRMWFGQDNIQPVGTKPTGASPYGCLDMAGNVWEWTSSLFKPYPYVAGDGREDPQAEGRRVARGGSWTGEPHIATTTYRFRPEPGFAHGYLGFRCAKNAQ